jgi:hypothetical protein
MSPWVLLVPNGLHRNAPYISYPALQALGLLPEVINNEGFGNKKSRGGVFKTLGYLVSTVAGVVHDSIECM